MGSQKTPRDKPDAHRPSDVLAEACAMLDPDEEVALAEEALGDDAEEWPEY